jgi:hypothetical protein
MAPGGPSGPLSGFEEGITMDSATPKVPRDAAEYRELPEPIRLDETTTSQEASDAPDPSAGRDADTEWLLRNSAG